MTETRRFDTPDEAKAFLETLGEYENPREVAPLKGEAAHEVAVGPVHAGVIEPGHFRFQCVGEDVYNLQIFLGYQRRGVEGEIVCADGRIARQIALAETCAGDTSIAAATCFAEIMESAFPEKFAAPANAALAARSALLELERIANHTGDLGALAGDVAYLPAASYCGRIRGDYLNMTASVCGNRFGRGAVVPGGIAVLFNAERASKVRELAKTAKRDLDDALKLMFEEPSVVERFSGTGVVTRETAEEIGLVGVARRASVEMSGDVLARAAVRRTEIEEAHGKLFSALDAIESAGCGCGAGGKSAEADVASKGTCSAVVATVDAWRGPLVHAAAFDEGGRMLRYRIVDPSAHNWHGLAWALRGEQISNFPICNKSFNLSYCGTDR